MITLKLTDDELLALATVSNRVTSLEAATAVRNHIDEYDAWLRARAWVDQAATDLLNSERGSRR